MNPLHLRGVNYRSFESFDIQLPAGCVAISGQNGAGKSSLMLAIDLCLFGPEGRSMEPYVSDAVVGDLELELEFDHDDVLYKVRRGFSARGRGKATLDLEFLCETTLTSEPLTLDSIAATQERLEQLIGMTRETFRASCFLAQGDSASFTEAQPRERKRILAECLGLQIWDRLLEQERLEKRALEGSCQQIAGKMLALEQQVAEKPAVEQRAKEAWGARDAADVALAGAVETVSNLTARIAEAGAAEGQRREAAARLASARQVLSVLTEQEAEAQRSAADLADVHREIAALKPKVDAIAALEQAVAHARQCQQRAEEHARRERANVQQTAEAERLRSEASMLLDRASRMEAEEDATCDRCGQPLHAEARRQALASLAGEIDDAQQKAVRLEQLVEDERAALEALRATFSDADPTPGQYEQQLELARDADRRLSMLGGRLPSLGQTASRLSDESFSVALMDARSAVQTAEQEVAMLPASDVDVDALRREAAGAQAIQREEQQRFDAAGQELARCDEALERIARAEQEIEEGQRSRIAADAELSLLEKLERAYGRDGIPALIVESVAVPAIEEAANIYLRELGTAFQVELRTQGQTKAGEARDTLDVVIHTEHGARPYETFSGGERTRVNLALRIALARFLAHRRGAESRLLAIDEPEFLDAAGVASLVEVLRSLEGFDRVYLVSHVPDLRDAFDASIQVVKSGGRSEVVA